MKKTVTKKTAEQAKIAASVQELETILAKPSDDQQLQELAECVFGKGVKLV